MLKSILTDNGKTLVNSLMQIPPNFQSLKDELDLGRYTVEDISMATAQFIEECFNERIEMEQVNQDAQGSIVPQSLHSAHLLDIARLLLDYGLNPNAIYESTNMMYELRYIDNGYLGPDTLALLLERGGDANLMADGEVLFDSLNFDVVFGAFNQKNRRRYDALVHCWFVLLGYGAKLQNGSSPINTFDGFELCNLKNHKEYTFGLSNVPGRGENWSLHIFNRNTLWEVARL